MWVFGQLNNRLKISVNKKEQGYSMDLTNPTPSKKNPEKYTTSMTTIKELSGIYPNIFNLLQENGVKEIDLPVEGSYCPDFLLVTCLSNRILDYLVKFPVCI